ncbi:Nitrogen assimilation regulatory protein [Gimesia maris]|uniref:sigma-54-dependent transcriptional regulator n=1 Tax=Gimesia maris TaxID=122 RepID=UPI00118C3D5C|nr:sigma 54-interacting transcriptional regulator [Gimesia maris]QDU15089.1 Nitrogen assimilation regulatory protein [Gimesia maris]
MESNQTILVLDDDLSVGKFIRDYIISARKKTFLASNAQEAIRLLKQHPIEILFVDLHLSDESGLSVIQKALQTHPNIVSVVVTGFGSLKSAIEAMRLGACDYLIKLFNRKQIIDSLNAALNLIQHRTSPHRQISPFTPEAKSLPEYFVYESKPMCEVVSQITKHSQMNVPVLISGEAGVGKRTLAKLIHDLSPFAEGEFFHIICSTIKNNGHLYEKNINSLEILQSEGNSSESQKRTIFFENVEQLPQWQQNQLMKLLKEGRIQTPWQPDSTSSSIRLIASTSVILEEEVDRG